MLFWLRAAFWAVVTLAALLLPIAAASFEDLVIFGPGWW